MSRSLKSQLVLGTSLSSAVVMAVLALSLYGSMRRSLIASFDAALRIQATRLGDLVEQDEHGVHFEFDPSKAGHLTVGGSPLLFEIADADGRLLAGSQRGDGWGFPVGLEAASHPVPITLPGGSRGRAVSIRVTPRAEDAQHPASSRTLRISVAGDPAEARSTLSLLAWRLGVGCAVATVAVGAVIIAIVRWQFRPVAKFASDIGGLGESDLDRRVAHHGLPTEIVPVALMLNALLARLQFAFERERAFAANASHELRTPIAGLRALIEVAQSQPRTAETYAETLADCLAVTGRLEVITRALLSLAVAEEGDAPQQPALVDLPAAVEQGWRIVSGLARQRELQLVTDLQPAWALVDADKLTVILAALLENAVQHSNVGGTVHLLTWTEGDYACVSFRNSGCLIGPSEATHIFDRLWRGDAARSAGSTHAGIGLSLVKSLSARIGAEVVASACKGEDFSISLELPASDTQHSKASA